MPLTPPEKIRHWVERPSVFMEEVFKIEPHPYNRDFLDDMYWRLIYRAARQVGKSTTVAVKILHFILFARYLTDTIQFGKVGALLMSLRIEQSMEIINRMKDLVNNTPYMRPYLIPEKKDRIRIMFYDMDGEGIVQAIPIGKKAEAPLGYTIHWLFFDEASDLQDNVYYKAAPTGATTDVNIALAGNPKKNMGFYRAACEDSVLCGSLSNDDRMGVPRVVSKDPANATWHQYNARTRDNPVVSEKLYAEYMKWPAEQKDTEIFGIFPRANYDGSLFSEDDLQAMLLAENPDWKDLTSKYNAWNYQLGIDPALGGDDTVYSLGKFNSNFCYIVHCAGKQTPKLKYIVDDTQVILNKYPGRSITINVDSNGIGKGVLDQLEDNNIMARGVPFSTQTKVKVYNQLIPNVEGRRIFFLNHYNVDKEIAIDQMRGMYLDKSGATPRILSNMPHDDYADGIALMNYDMWANATELWHDEDGNVLGVDDLFG